MKEPGKSLRQYEKKSIIWYIGYLITLALFVWAIIGMNINIDRIRQGVPAMGRIISLMFPPDTARLESTVFGMIETIQIAVIGTTMAAIFSIPISFLAARNLDLPRIVPRASKQVLNAIRTFPSLIFGIFFVASYGPGPLAGVMALGINSIGMLGKLNSEIVESIDRGPIEALDATGANGAEMFLYAVIPQVLPEFIGTTLYRFELNLRQASVLGLVGAGGIGVTLMQALQFRRWAIVGMTMLVIIVVVTIIDYSSAYVRNKII